MDSLVQVKGAIVDSWIERAKGPGAESWLVLQVAPRGRPQELMIVEAAASLVPDRGWLEDLGANLCHGNLVSALARRTISGLLRATEIHLIH